ncbi:MAG: DNA replication/repair protein RecF [Gammaproteobacteria bacterium]|nr:DNA replication/repair protein RecF [Gammaproteobacteria bacterium]
MTISQLSLTDFRNLRSATLDFDPCFNLIAGENGSGKTSLLEAIFVLCQAHSFRTCHLKQCINHTKSNLLLFGRFSDFKAGLSRSGSKLVIHVNGEAVKRRSELVKRAPINIVNSDSFALIDGAPQKRRAFIDWCLFHVEHSFAESWSEFKHALRQRNRLLKTRQDLKLLDYWDEHLLKPSLRLHQMRKRQCAVLQKIFALELDELLHGIPIELEYRQGWPESLELKESLIEHRQRDVQSGFTNFGVHRDDLILTSQGRKVGEVLSRGQSKRLGIALMLAALKLVNKCSQQRIILLIDDLQSELDLDAQKRVYQQLREMDLQLFISNIDSGKPEALAAKEFKMFHVEHGTIKPRNFS